MIKRVVNLLILFLACATSAYAINFDDLIKPANPLEFSQAIGKLSAPQKVTLTKNDLYNQYKIALDKFIQSNVKSSYSDFKILIENTSPKDFMYMSLAEKMADIGFFDLAELSLSKVDDKDLSYFLSEDITRFYFPVVTLSKTDELYLAEMYSNIIYNDQSEEVVGELVKEQNLLNKYDYANYIVALGYYKSNKFKEAEKYINKAISMNTKNLNYKKLKTEILSETSKPKNVMKLVEEIKSQLIFTKSFSQKVKSIEEYALYKTTKNEFEKKYHLAYYFYLENELNKSMRTLQTAFNTKKSNNKKVYALLSRVYYDLKEYEKAEDNAQKACKIDKKNRIALSVLGDLALKNNEYKDAAKYFELASDTIKMAEVYQRLGKTKKAYEIYEKILKTQSDAYEAYYNMALLDKTREIPYLKKSIAVNYKFKDGWIDLARCSIENNDYENASKYLSIVKYIDENDFRYYYYQGLVYKNKGLASDATRSFKKSLMLNPNYVPAKEELSI